MGDIAIGFVLDQSGSMSVGREETLKGFNAFKEEQAAQPGNAFLTLVLFADNPTVRLRGGDMKLVDDLGTPMNSYNPSGSTALYDAVDITISEMEKWLGDNTSFFGQVLIVILTDGYENASRNINLPALNIRITDKKENAGWEFVFLGSGGAAWTEGQKMEVPVASSLRYAGKSYAAFATLSGATSSSRASGQSLNSTLPQQDQSWIQKPSVQEPSEQDTPTSSP